MMPYVLLVDDDPITLYVHHQMLKNWGYTVDCAVNGNQAIALCLNSYDLIFMDCGLPDIDGFTASKTIRELENIHQIAPRPIIMLSAYTHTEQLQAECIAANINCFITKPVSFEILKNIVSDCLNTTPIKSL